MVALPLWAKVARRVNEFPLWVMTQLAAGTLAIAAWHVDSLVGFWAITQAMLAFKASYLLIYPFVMRLEEKDRHLGVAGLFSVLIHFGAIGGALLGGWLLEFADPRSIYLIMAGTDALQAAVCVFIIRRHKVAFRQSAVPALDADRVPEAESRGNPLIVQLGIVSLLFYLSAFLMRPFFSPYWTMVSGNDSELLAGAVYAIPAWVALAGLWLNRRGGRNGAAMPPF